MLGTAEAMKEGGGAGHGVAAEERERQQRAREWQQRAREWHERKREYRE